MCGDALGGPLGAAPMVIATSSASRPSQYVGNPQSCIVRLVMHGIVGGWRSVSPLYVLRCWERDTGADWTRDNRSEAHRRSNRQPREGPSYVCARGAVEPADAAKSTQTPDPSYHLCSDDRSCHDPSV